MNLSSILNHSASAILITPESGRFKIRKWNSLNLSVRGGFQCLGHSNWTICSLLSQFCPLNFPTFSLSYWRANSYYPTERKAENGKMEFSNYGWDTRVSVPGAFKLDHLQLFKANFVLNSTQLYFSLLAIKFPPLPILRKRKSSVFQKLLTENKIELSLQID